MDRLRREWLWDGALGMISGPLMATEELPADNISRMGDHQHLGLDASYGFGHPAIVRQSQSVPVSRKSTSDPRSPKIALIIGVTGQDGAYLARLLEKNYIAHGTSRDAAPILAPF